MVEVQIKRVDMYDIGNDLMIVDTILYNPNPTDVIVGIDIYVRLPEGNKILGLTQPVFISDNSYSVFRSDALKFVPEVTISIRRCLNIYNNICQTYSDEEEAIMNSNIVQGEPPDPSMISMDSIYAHTNIDIINPLSFSLVSPSSITLQTDTIQLFDGAPVKFSGSSIPNRKISIYNIANKRVLTTAQTDTYGKYSTEYHMLSGISNVVTFSIRACNTNIDNTLDLTNVSNQITMSVKPVSVVRYPADVKYTGLRNRENGIISIPTKGYPSKLDALSALKTEVEKLVQKEGATLLIFEYGYTATSSNHIYDVTYYYVRSIVGLDNKMLSVRSIENTNGRAGSPAVIQKLQFWEWLLFLIKIMVILYVAIQVIKRSGLINLLPDWAKKAILDFGKFIEDIGTGMLLIVVGYVAIKFGPAIINYLSARKTEKAFTKASETKRLTA